MITSATRAATCPVCRSPAPQPLYRFPEFAILGCTTCKSSWRSNMYDEAQIEALYQADEYGAHPYFEFGDGMVERREKPRYRNFDEGLRRIEAATGLGRLLDVACGSGAFLSIAKQRGWACEGVELSETLAASCERNTGVPVSSGRFEDADLDAASYDAVTLWDIIEHVIDPVACLRKAQALLRPGGVLLVCTPDENSLLARIGEVLYRSSAGRVRGPALALHPRYHTYFFRRRGFVRLLAGLGFDVIGAYSQAAYFEHSPLASRAEKLAIAGIERAAGLIDARYEFVVVARAGAA